MRRQRGARRLLWQYVGSALRSHSVMVSISMRTASCACKLRFISRRSTWANLVDRLLKSASATAVFSWTLTVPTERDMAQLSAAGPQVVGGLSQEDASGVPRLSLRSRPRRRCRRRRRLAKPSGASRGGSQEGQDPRRAGPFQNEALRGLWRRNPGGGRLDGWEPEVGPQLSNREKPLRDLTRVRKRAGPFQN